jgi:threonine synthase
MKPSADFYKRKIRKTHYSLWRYAEFFPYVKEKEIISLGEGWTPIVKFSNNLFFKMDHLNPTGSFKDRGSTVLISAIQEQIKKIGAYISEDSSGNAGASIAAYAARANLKAKIYVPEAVSGQKVNQTRWYDAEIVKVSGTRNMITEAAQKPEKGKVYVGHLLHPLFRDGIRSLAFEIAEQFSWDLPECVYVPVSAGTLMLGLISGLVQLRDSGAIDTVPKVWACQTKIVSPLYHRIKRLKYSPPENVRSVADALISVNPPLLDMMVKKLKEVGGDSIIVEENEIVDAHKELARNGFFVEPSSAVAYAGYKKNLENQKTSADTKTLLEMTGNGLKTLMA